MEYNLLDDEILQNAFLDDDPAADYKARQGNYVDDEDGEDYSLDSPYEPVDTSNAEDMPGAFTEKQQTQQVEQKPVVTSMLDLVRKTEPKQDKDIIEKTKKEDKKFYMMKENVKIEYKVQKKNFDKKI